MIYGKLAIAAFLALLIGTSVYKYGTYRENLVRVEYQQRDLKAAQDYAQKEREVTAQYRSKEENWQQQFVAASRAYQKGLANAHTQNLADAAAVDAGRIRLLDPGSNRPACGDSTTKTSASTSGRNGDEGSELSAKAAKFLLSLAGDADAVAMQLSACQQVLSSERR